MFPLEGLARSCSSRQQRRHRQKVLSQYGNRSDAFDITDRTLTLRDVAANVVNLRLATVVQWQWPGSSWFGHLYSVLRYFEELNLLVVLIQVC